MQPRAYKRTTLPGQEPVDRPDLIGRDFTAAAPGQRLVGDITYLRTGEGWLYLATVIDLATRMVVGWQLAEHMRTTLVTDALQMAIDAGHVAARGDLPFRPRHAIHLGRVRPVLRRATASGPASGRTGVCWDNAAAESFFATLKNEMYYRQPFPPGPGPGSPSPSTSRSSTTAGGCTPPSATAPRPKPSPTTRPEQRPDQQPEDLSKILDTAMNLIGIYVVIVGVDTMVSALAGRSTR